MKTLLTIVGIMLAILVGMVLVVILAVMVSPRPFVWFLRSQGVLAGEASKPVDFAQYEGAVEVVRDVQYPSKFSSNTFDVFYPKGSLEPLPTLLWIHGGGFFTGDKAGVAPWATMIASNGYTVVSMNYEVAPENHYPGPVEQMGEMYRYLVENQDEYPTVDVTRLIVGGDSAGGQISSQWIATQTNPALAEATGIAAEVPQGDLIGAILYCGPYNVQDMDAGGSSAVLSFFVNQLGWAYFGERNWATSQDAENASSNLHVTADYPPTFLTDGNTFSFEPHAHQLQEALEAQGVAVDSLFYTAEHGGVSHEYQFDFATPESAEAFERTLAFLARVTAVQ